MEVDLFMWFLCGCYLLGGITIGWFGGIWWRNRKPKRSGTGRWDYKGHRPDTEDGGYFK
jgi:hypothetical protein